MHEYQLHLDVPRMLPGHALLPPQPLQPATTPVRHRYRVPLPSTCISFCSNEGEQIFREALATSYMQGYFRLAANFSTQSEPAYCGLSTLATVLNTLQVDPHSIWKGPWRWYDESMFDCCVDLQDARRRGITLSQFVRLAECNGLAVTCVHPPVADAGDGEEHFRSAVRDATARDDVIPVVSFSRAVLQQTGDGHFSTLAGYHEARDLVLVLDTARFKYLPYWAPLSLLYEAMKPVDMETGLSRGYCLLRKAKTIAAAQLRLAVLAPPRSLSLVRQRTCALLHATAWVDISPDSVSLWNSVADVISQSLLSPATAKQAPTLRLLDVGGGEGNNGSSAMDQCSCPAAAVGAGGWTVLRRGIEQSPIFSHCSDHTQRIQAVMATECEWQGGTIAATTSATCCQAAAHAAAALRPAHQLALLVLSWPFGSGWHAMAVDAPEKQPCCAADDALNVAHKAVAMENCAKDLVAAQGNPMLNSVTDLLRARIVLLLKGSTSFG